MKARWIAGWVALVSVCWLARVSEAQADTVVQVPLVGVLDARSVTTLTNGVLVPFTLPTDGGGLQNAFVTQAVATKQGQPTAYALPDDGKFAANARHPEVVLSYSNAADAASPQTHLVKAGEVVSFAVPNAVYSKLFVFFNGAAGGTTVTFTLTYTDGTDTRMATVPDYYADISPTDPVVFNLATNLAKYDKTSKVNEVNHHNLTGVELVPTAGKTLKQVSFTRNAMGNLVFWGATGVATSDVAGTGGTGAGGSAGAGGAATAGAGGASAGMTGASAGATQTAGTGGAAAGAGGSPAAAGSPASAGTAPLPNSAAADDGGCTVSTKPRDAGNKGWLLVAAAALCLGRRRRSR